MTIKHLSSSVRGIRSSMQDDFTVIENLSGYFYVGIYDGHSGIDSVGLVSSKLHKLVSANLIKGITPLKALKQACIDIDAEIHESEYDDGTTASVALIKDNLLFLANVGDSRVVMRQGEEVIQLTKDHKITDPDELAQYRSSNWFKTTSRLISKGKIKKFSLSNISRSLGDRSFEDAISPVPDLTEIKLQGTETIIFATDGLWGKVDNLEVFTILDDKDDSSLTERLVSTALEKGSSDNITVVYVSLQ